jgi:hypothetical protein
MDEETRQGINTTSPFSPEPVTISMRLDLAKSLHAQLRVVSAGLADNGMNALAVELDRIIAEFLVLPS